MRDRIAKETSLREQSITLAQKKTTRGDSPRVFIYHAHKPPLVP